MTDGVTNGKNVMNGLGFRSFLCTFAVSMNQGRSETITTRIISTTFIVVALAVFKPFGLDTWQWQGYVHLIALGVIGFSICMMTDIILRYIVKMPRSFKKGVEYIIRRNLWFQLINTPLVALGICLYRHFVLNDRVQGNQFSVVNFLETLVIIAFCSFAIGLYWRFKFRSKYLAMELEETRLLNEELKEMQEKSLLSISSDSPTVDTNVNSEVRKQDISAVNEVKELSEKSHPQELTLTGTTNESVTLQISNLLYIEAVGNYMKVGGNVAGLSDDRPLPSCLPGQPWSGRADRLTFRLHPVAHQALPRITPRLAQQHVTSQGCYQKYIKRTFSLFKMFLRSPQNANLRSLLVCTSPHEGSNQRLNTLIYFRKSGGPCRRAVRTWFLQWWGGSPARRACSR